MLVKVKKPFYFYYCYSSPPPHISSSTPLHSLPLRPPLDCGLWSVDLDALDAGDLDPAVSAWSVCVYFVSVLFTQGPGLQHVSSSSSNRNSRAEAAGLRGSRATLRTVGNSNEQRATRRPTHRPRRQESRTRTSGQAGRVRVNTCSSSDADTRRCAHSRVPRSSRGGASPAATTYTP